MLFHLHLLPRLHPRLQQQRLRQQKPAAVKRAYPVVT